MVKYVVLLLSARALSEELRNQPHFLSKSRDIGPPNRISPPVDLRAAVYLADGGAAGDEDEEEEPRAAVEHAHDAEAAVRVGVVTVQGGQSGREPLCDDVKSKVLPQY